jgi:glycosyltransferase involved in cell wall biosynthesis
MRVLLASLRQTGGISTYTLSVARGLVEAGHDAVLLDETLEFEGADGRLQVEPLPATWRLPHRLLPLEGLKLRARVHRLAREREADVVHVTNSWLAPRHERLILTAWDPIPGPVARMRAARSRGLQPGEEGVFALADAIAARRAAAVVSVTAPVHEAMRRRGRRSELIPCFIEDSAVDEARAGEGRPNDVLIVGMGIDAPRKGLDLAIEATGITRAEVPDARLLIAGDFMDPGARDRLPDFCEPLGPLPAAELRERFRSAGCLLIASRWEEFGYAGLEALAAGTPVACAPLPAFEGISGGGVFMAERSAPELARAIRRALACTAFDFPDECRASVAVPRLVDLYREMMRE